MGSYSFWDAPQCERVGCQPNADGFGVICSVCLAGAKHVMACLVGMAFVDGDGLEDDGECNRCEMRWFDWG